MGVEYQPGPRLGEILLQRRVISADQLRIALAEQSVNGFRLGRVLVQLGFVTESLLRESLAESLGQETIDLESILPDPQALQLLPAEQARSLGVFPVSYATDQSRLLLAMPDALDIALLDRLRAELGRRVEIQPLLAGETDITAAIERFYGHEQTLEGVLAEVESGRGAASPVNLGTDEFGQPMVRLVNAVLTDAVRQGASDIHIEPERGFLRLRYRLDGVMHQVLSLHARYTSPMVVRLKVMAGMDIAETRSPQDGRISLTVSGRSIDFRVSSLRTAWGENIVLRVLDHRKGVVGLEQLGLPEDSLTALNAMLARPEGLLLVSGPTGSGKTTTLYAALSRLSTESVNVMTLEDPIEYELPLVRQANAGESGRLGFARGIRHLMRQDPDIILVGEVRDEETADMALRAAMTGHQVFSTLHSASATGAIARLRDLGVKPDILAGNLIGIVGQRLLRRLCLHCREPDPAAPLIRRRLSLDNPDLGDLSLNDAGKPARIHAAKGCERCRHSGYRGRVAIVEILAIDTVLEQMIAAGATPIEIGRAARAQGFVPLAQAGIRRVLDGTTSWAELNRMIDLDRNR